MLCWIQVNCWAVAPEICPISYSVCVTLSFSSLCVTLQDTDFIGWLIDLDLYNNRKKGTFPRIQTPLLEEQRLNLNSIYFWDSHQNLTQSSLPLCRFNSHQTLSLAAAGAHRAESCSLPWRSGCGYFEPKGSLVPHRNHFAASTSLRATLLYAQGINSSGQRFCLPGWGRGLPKYKQ